MPEVLARIESAGRSGSVPFGTKEYKDLIGFLQIASRSTLMTRIKRYAEDLGARGEVFLAHQSAQRATGNINIPVKLPDGTVAKKASFLFEASTWTEAYAANKATSYVFAYDRNKRERVRVHLAAERALAERNLSFAPNCALSAKLGIGDVDAVRPTLRGDWLPYRLPRDFVRRDETAARIKRQADRFATFLRPIDEDF